MIKPLDTTPETPEEEPYSWKWGTALESLHQFENAIGVLALVAEGAPVPQWVRSEITAWLENERPPSPTRKDTDEDIKLRNAAEKVRDKANWRPREPKGDSESGRISRIAEEEGVKPLSLENYCRCKGRAYNRDKALRIWYRVYRKLYDF
jgi:hypothetical protein